MGEVLQFGNFGKMLLLRKDMEDLLQQGKVIYAVLLVDLIKWENYFNLEKIARTS